MRLRQCQSGDLVLQAAVSWEMWDAGTTPAAVPRLSVAPGGDEGDDSAPTAIEMGDGIDMRTGLPALLQRRGSLVLMRPSRAIAKGGVLST